MKKITLLLALLCALITVNAQDFTADGLCYQINGTNVTVVQGSDYATTLTGALNIPDQVSNNGTTYTVTAIGDYAFFNCTEITSVVIPNTVTLIGNSAFFLCTGMTDITIGNSVTTISDNAFMWCSSLTSLNIPASVTYIGQRLLDYCNSLTTLTVDSNNTVYDSRDNCNAIIYTQMNNLYRACNGTVIPSSVRVIDYQAFSACTGITSIDIPENIVLISWNAFTQCENLVNINLPNTLVSIDGYAFSNCTALTSITIPASVSYIGTAVFNACPNLESIVVDSENIYYDSRNNCNAIIETGSSTLIQGCKNSIIPSDVAAIGQYAFQQCWYLTSINIPESVTTIGTYAFAWCSMLKTVTFPTSLSYIGDYAFAYCNGLNEIYAYPEGGAVTLGSNVWDGVPQNNCNLHVYPECAQWYSNADQWKEFNVMGNLDQDGIEGDVTGEGDVDVSDVNAIINIILNKNTPDDYPGDADITGEGTIDVSDVNALINIILAGGPASPTSDYTVNGVTFTMVNVKGGSFTMGATSEQGSDYNENELPTHQVTLSNYSIGATEVTQELWQAVMGNNPSYFTTAHGYTEDLQRPVENVNWNDCQQFIAKLNEMTGQTFRLPTEAEWEYAARGGKKSRGFKYSGNNNINNVAWYISTIPSQAVDTEGYNPQPVGTKNGNELIIYDMSGNVWEWCQDWFGTYSSDDQTNPTGPANGNARVLRGGCYKSQAEGCRITVRDKSNIYGKANSIGLRLAK